MYTFKVITLNYLSYSEFMLWLLPLHLGICLLKKDLKQDGENKLKYVESVKYI